MTSTSDKSAAVLYHAVSSYQLLEVILHRLTIHPRGTAVLLLPDFIREKYPQLPTDIRWHMIGHLQRNKVKYIVDKVYMIHSVDSLRLAEEISKEAVKKNCTVKILIEVNVANEATKFGTQTEDTIALVTEIAKLPGIEINGLMTIAPYVENAEENRQYFSKLKQLSVDIMHKNIDNIKMNTLSMGMTGDYEVAVEEGATFVRVGTGIFGERDYTKNI